MKEKRVAVRQTMLMEKPDLVCLQETKLADVNNTLVVQTCGRKLKQFEYLEAEGTKGGILIAWCDKKFKLINSTKGNYSLTLVLEYGDEKIQVTSVYGPTVASLRRDFFQEIKNSMPAHNMPWLLCGDFNVTLQQEDRNNVNNRNWRETVKFADLVMELELINLPLTGKHFTWSNSRVMARLDRFLISAEWSATFPNSKQEALANTSSDHNPIIFKANTGFKKTRFFKFENSWLQSEQFRIFVRHSWQEMGPAYTGEELHQKICRLQTAIKEWSNAKIGNIKAQLMVCRDYLDWIGKVEEARDITQLEKWLKAVIKKRFTKLSMFEEEIWR